MKIVATVLMFLVLFLPNAHPEDYTQWDLPSGAVGRIGKGWVDDIVYSPDGARLAVLSSAGIWLYDTTTYRAVALLTGHRVAFSPDGTLIASRSGESTVRLWDTETGEPKRVFTGYMGMASVVFSPDGTLIASGSGDGTILLWKVH